MANRTPRIVFHAGLPIDERLISLSSSRTPLQFIHAAQVRVGFDVDRVKVDAVRHLEGQSRAALVHFSD
jgi:hypothetical protein